MFTKLNTTTAENNTKPKQPCKRHRMLSGQEMYQIYYVSPRAHTRCTRYGLLQSSNFIL